MKTAGSQNDYSCMRRLRFDTERHGFTLVELLVVMAVISVLASLLLPALEKSISAARLVACKNNLRSLGMAMNAYADNHNETYPIQSWYKNATQYESWSNVLRHEFYAGENFANSIMQPERAATNIGYCPDYHAESHVRFNGTVQKPIVRVPGVGDDVLSVADWLYLSYLPNAWITTPWMRAPDFGNAAGAWYTSGRTCVRRADIRQPHMTMLFGESWTTSGIGLTTYDNVYFNPRHNNVCPVVTADCAVLSWLDDGLAREGNRVVWDVNIRKTDYTHDENIQRWAVYLSPYYR